MINSPFRLVPKDEALIEEQRYFDMLSAVLEILNSKLLLDYEESFRMTTKSGVTFAITKEYGA